MSIAAAVAEKERQCIWTAFSGSTTARQLEILFCIWDDNVERFTNEYAREAIELKLNCDLEKLTLIANYKAAIFTGKKRSLQIIHVAALFSAHRILEELLNKLPPDNLKAKTEDSLTAAHISAALGDYIALRMLIEKNIPVSELDMNDRTPLHYAAQTNIESMIVILTESMDLIKNLDRDYKTPIAYASEYNRKFLRYHRWQRDGGYYNGQREIQENLRSAPFLFDSYFCLKPRRGIRKGGYRERFSAIQDLMKRRHEDFILRPTNTFGQFESPLSPVISQYIRIAQETKFEQIDNLLFTIWQLPKPQLVLTFYGTDPKSTVLTKLLQRSLGMITRQTRTWLLTDGKLGGTAELVAQAIRGYTEAYGMKELQVIGLTPWALLTNAQLLSSDDFLGKTHFSLPQRTISSDKEIQLAENHTHYLLVDTKSKTTSEMIDFRARFEAWILRRAELVRQEAQKQGNKDARSFNSNSSTSSKQSNTAEMSPVCGILVGGDKRHLQQVKKALYQNIPFVVISDSGGLASVLERCFNMMRNQRSPTNQRLRWSILNINQKKIAAAVKDIWELEENDLGLLENILNHANLLEFISYRACSGAELDARIVKSLTKSEIFEGVDAADIWKFRLRMALQLNRTDFLRENMFAGVDWSMVPADFVEISLLEDKREFLQMLLESGFPLHKFINLELILRLYQADYKSDKPQAETFKNLVSSACVTRGTITRAVLNVVLTKTLWRNSAEFVPKAPDKNRGKQSGHTSPGPVPEWDEEDSQRLLLQLVIWAFIFRRFELSHTLWLLLREPIPAALLLVNLAHKMQKKQQAHKEMDELQRMATFYEIMACNILDECYSNDPPKTLNMLCMERPAYLKRSQLTLAEEGECKYFIEHQGSQTCVKGVWFGNISEKISTKRFLFCLLLGLIPIPLAPFIAKYKETREIQIPQKQSIEDAFFQDEDIETTRHERVRARTKQLGDSATPCVKRIKDFYCAPRTRFAYNCFLCVALLIACSLFIVFKRSFYYFPIHYGVLWAIAAGFLLENIRVAIVKGQDFKQYFNDTWNIVFLGFMCLFILGNVASMQSLSGYIILFWLARLCFAICLLMGFAFLFRFCVVSRSIGPKLLMIKKMVVGDLLPFLGVVLIFWLAFTVFLVVQISKYPYGYEDIGFGIFLRNAFFAMFGEFNLDDTVEELDKLTAQCSVPGGCTYPYYHYTYPLAYGVYVLCTHVILINLLIAMFTKRYDEMESESKQMWAMQQLGLVKTFANAPPLPTTLMFLWPFYCIYVYGKSCFKTVERRKCNPFCRKADSRRYERQIISWQKCCSLDFLRQNILTVRMALENSKFGLKDSKRKGIFAAWEESETKAGHRGDDMRNDTKRALETVAALQNTFNELSDGLGAVNPELFQMQRSVTPRPELPAGNPQFMNSMLSVPQTNNNGLGPRPSFRATIQDRGGSFFNGEELKIAFFVSPFDEFISEGLPKPIPWDVELGAYQPVAPDSADEGFLQWIGRGPAAPAASPQPLPRNPLGRTGVAGRGRLPAYGENKAFYLVFTLDKKWDDGNFEPQSQSVRRNVLLRSVHRGENHLPWFLCNHAPTEDINGLLEVLILAYMQRMALDLAKREPDSYHFHSNLRTELKKCKLSYEIMGCLSDKVNSDNAWIEVTAIHIQVPDSYNFWELLPQLFSVRDVKATWESLSSLPPLRESHLQAIAVFNENLLHA